MPMYCSGACRQAAYRRRRSGTTAATGSARLARPDAARPDLGLPPDLWPPIDHDVGDAYQTATGNLPAFSDTFVGRQREVAIVAKMLGGGRLVTLTGPAGVGKTRLASRAASLLVDEYADGTRFVDLVPITAPALVGQTVADALSLTQQPGRTVEELLVAQLRSRHLLLVLDNCEHLLAACSAMVEALLSGCPHLSVLATSQEPLAVPGEQVRLVPPLSVPDQGTSSAGRLQASEAVRLFCCRAKAAGAGFGLTPELAPAVAEICRRLDGLPLAIELAAGCTNVRSVPVILAHLDDRFAVLGSGRPTARPRHQTLRAAIDWSYGLLSQPEAALLRRLSVFAGEASMTGIGDVCTGGVVERDQVFALMDRLVSKSFVVAQTDRPEPRFRLLETIRQYAAQRLLELGEAPPVRLRHAAWCLSVVEETEPGLTGREQRVALERLDLEMDNVRAAFDLSVVDGHAELAVRLAGALTVFWRVRGYFGEGRQRLNKALSLAEGVADTYRARVLWGAGFMELMHGDYDRAAVLVDAALDLYERKGDAQGCARSLLLLGNSRMLTGHHSEGLRLQQESAALASRAGDGWCLSLALAGCGAAQIHKGNLHAAREMLDECVTLGRAYQDLQGLGMGLNLLGFVNLEQGDYPAAESRLTECLVVSREMGDTWGTSVALAELGRLAMGRGEYGRAAALIGDSLSTARQAGAIDVVLQGLCYLGESALAEGDLSRAGSLFVEAASLAKAEGLGDSHAVAGLGRLAMVRRALGEARASLELALAGARARALKVRAADLVHDLGNLARHERDWSRAMALHHEALQLRHEVGARPRVAQSLEALAGLSVASGAAVRGTPTRAASVFGAAQALRAVHGYARGQVDQARYDADVALLRRQLTAAPLEAAWEKGRRMSLDDAFSYASQRRSDRPSKGWESLTPAERKVAALVGQGLTNSEMAAALFVSVNTVKAHLSNIYDKVDVSSRRQLVREAAQRGTGQPTETQDRFGETSIGVWAMRTPEADES